MTLFAAVRCARIKSLGELRQIEAHGLRKDDASARRVDPSRTVQNLAESRYSPEKPLAIIDAFKRFKAATAAVEGGKNAALGMHVLAVVSPQLISEFGDLHDPANPKNQIVFEQAQEWARETFGPDSLIAARMDMDEKGGGLVDLVVCPTALKQGGRGRKPKLTISVRDALAKVQSDHGTKTSYSALQDSWANFARQHVDPRLERGKPKQETGRQHVIADILRDADELRQQARQELAKASTNAAETFQQARAEASKIIKLAKLEETRLHIKLKSIEDKEKHILSREDSLAAREEFIGYLGTKVTRADTKIAFSSDCTTDEKDHIGKTVRRMGRIGYDWASSFWKKMNEASRLAKQELENAQKARTAAEREKEAAAKELEQAHGLRRRLTEWLERIQKVEEKVAEIIRVEDLRQQLAEQDQESDYSGPTLRPRGPGRR